MTWRVPVWAIGLALIAAACTGGDDRTSPADEVTTLPGAPTTTAAPPPPTAAPTTGAAVPTAPLGPDVVGRLVVLDAAGSVVTLNPDGSDPIVIADAAQEGAVFFQPLWAPGSERLAWSEASPAGFAVVISRADGTDRSAATMPTPPFYFYWAPDGRHIAALHNGLNGSIDLKLISVGKTESTLMGTGAPFYISWNRETGDLVAHIGADRLETIDRSGGARDLGPTTAGYQAPQWIPGGIVHLDGSDLQLLDASGRSQTLLIAPGPVSFVANPQGTRLAIQSFGEDEPTLTVALQRVPEIRPNVVVVVDLATRETTIVSTHSALAFFWSPDGERLLILDAAARRGLVEALVWEGGDPRLVTTFAPSPSFAREVLPFFSQYAQSYQMWSPDSTAFAFAGRVGDEDGIWVQPIDGSTAHRVTSGTWVSWSN